MHLDAHRAIGRMLQVGLVVACVLMLYGVIDALATHHEADVRLTLREMPAALATGDPNGWICLGLVVLTATPILRVLALIGVFLFERDARFAGVALLVAIVIATGVILGHV